MLDPAKHHLQLSVHETSVMSRDCLACLHFPLSILPLSLPRAFSSPSISAYCLLHCIVCIVKPAACPLIAFPIIVNSRPLIRPLSIYLLLLLLSTCSSSHGCSSRNTTSSASLSINDVDLPQPPRRAQFSLTFLLDSAHRHLFTKPASVVQL
jgi:hypothetical protein